MGCILVTRMTNGVGVEIVLRFVLASMMKKGAKLRYFWFQPESMMFSTSVCIGTLTTRGQVYHTSLHSKTIHLTSAMIPQPVSLLVILRLETPLSGACIQVVQEITRFTSSCWVLVVKT